MDEQKEASVRTQWLLILLAVVLGVGLAVWWIGIGRWWLLIGLAVASGVSAHAAWQAGLPLWPGRPPRTGR